MLLSNKRRGRAMSDMNEYAQHYFDIVARVEEIEPGWTVRIIKSGGGLCLHAKREIWVSEEHLTGPHMLLHEIAHIRHKDHDVHWGDEYTRLCEEYADMWGEQ
jgi:hypothetical protein